MEGRSGSESYLDSTDDDFEEISADKTQSHEASSIIQENIEIDDQHQSIWRKLKSPWAWPGLKRALYNTLLFPIRVAFNGLSAPITYFLTDCDVHRQPYRRDIQDKGWLRDYQATQETAYAGKWSSFEIFATKDSRVIPINGFLLNDRENSHKLHINVHGVGNSANCFDGVAPMTASEVGADQWNMTRRRSFTVEGQKVQLRVVIAAAIQQGYTDIRLDGFSYGAGLVRTVYHELIADPEHRQFLEDKKITLHYTARNGYESEGLTFAAHLLGRGGKTHKNYIKNGAHAPKANFFMKVISFVVDELILFDNTLRNKAINAPIPEGSMNYVANCVVSTGKNQLVNDGLIAHTNRTSSREKYGHTCVDVKFKATDEWKNDEGYQFPKKGVIRHRVCVNQTSVYKEVNQRMLQDRDVKNNEAEEYLKILKREWESKNWKVVGGKKIDVAAGKKTVPHRVKKQHQVIKRADRGEISWSAAFFEVKEISRKAAENPSLSRYSTSQAYYDKIKKARLDNKR